jgi:ketosteroid isomerase-like protein
MGTREVVEKHLEALRAAELDAVLANFAEDAVLITGESVYRGHDGLEELFRPVLEAMFAPPESWLTLDSLTVDGEHALITWRMGFPGGEVTFGTDTFVVRGGKIVVQTGAAQLA